MKALNILALTLIIVGGINWGLVGLFDLDIVAALFGAATLASKAVYSLIGLAAVYGLAFLFKPVSHYPAHASFAHR